MDLDTSPKQLEQQLETDAKRAKQEQTEREEDKKRQKEMEKISSTNPNDPRPWTFDRWERQTS